jgi:hypothetical protein
MSHRARHALFFVLASFAVAGRAQQAGAPSAAAQPAETPAASKPTQLAPVHVNGGPSDDILRSARDAGFKIKTANGTTHFCKTEAPLGTRFVSESCMNEQQVSLWLIRAQAQKDKLTSMLGAPTSTR